MLLLEQLQRLDKIDVEMSVTSTIKFIVNLEDPSCDLQILSYQLGQGVDELLLVVYIYTANWSRHIGKLEDLLCSRFGRIKVLL